MSHDRRGGELWIRYASADSFLRSVLLFVQIAGFSVVTRFPLVPIVCLLGSFGLTHEITLRSCQPFRQPFFEFFVFDCLLCHKPPDLPGVTGLGRGVLPPLFWVGTGTLGNYKKCWFLQLTYQEAI
jgi:hypothetical protein